MMKRIAEGASRIFLACGSTDFRKQIPGLVAMVTLNFKLTTLVSGTQKINAIKLGVRGFVRICIETCARGCFGAWKYRFRKKGMLIRQMLFICQK